MNSQENPRDGREFYEARKFTTPLGLSSQKNNPRWGQSSTQKNRKWGKTSGKARENPGQKEVAKSHNRNWSQVAPGS